MRRRRGSYGGGATMEPAAPQNAPGRPQGPVRAGLIVAVIVVVKAAAYHPGGGKGSWVRGNSATVNGRYETPRLHKLFETSAEAETSSKIFLQSRLDSDFEITASEPR